MRPRPVVFLGPSLPLARAQAVLEADYRPPVRKGDVYRCLGSGVDTIAIIDGVFHNEPSVWQREIIEALDEGIHVCGASSMGAIRAVELQPYGMLGIGTVFEWYRDGVVDGDDEVALLFGPSDHGYPSLSEPLVSIRATLARAKSEDVLTDAEAAVLVAHARSLYYPTRTYRALLEAPLVAAWTPGRRQQFETFLFSRAVDLKQQDALLLLSHLGVHQPAPRSVCAVAPAIFGARLGYRTFVQGAETRTAAQLIDAVAPEVRDRFRRASNRKWFLQAWAEDRDLRCPDDFGAEFRERFEARRGVGDRASWLRARSLTEGEYARWLAEEALAAWLEACGAEGFGLRPTAGDPAAPFLVDWADSLGIVHPDGGPIVDWLLEVGPDPFGFSNDTWLRLVVDIQVASGDQAQLREHP